MRGSIRIGNIMGISFGINYSWFAVFVLVTVSLGQYYFPHVYPSWSTATSWAVGVATSLLFFASVVLHELAHSVVATRSGIPVKSITLFIFGGVARITREASRPRTELAMASAGPLSSVALAGVFALVWLFTVNSIEMVAAVGTYLAWTNVSLALFNLIPGFPMDGGRIFRSLVWVISKDYRRSTRIATFVGKGFAVVFVVSGVLLAFVVGISSGLWLTPVGVFLYVAASTSYRHTVLVDSLKGLTAGGLALRDCPAVPGATTIQDLVRFHFLLRGNRCIQIQENSETKGIITASSIKSIPRKRWENTKAFEVMTPIQNVEVVAPADSALAVLEKLAETGPGIVVVSEGNTVLGFIEREGVLNFGKTRSLGHEPSVSGLPMAGDESKI